MKHVSLVIVHLWFAKHNSPFCPVAGVNLGHKARILDELESSRESLDSASREFNNCGALHDAAWAGLQDVSLRTTELKREADDAQERSRGNDQQLAIEISTVL